MWEIKTESEKKNGKSGKQFTTDPCVNLSCDRLCFLDEGCGFLCGRKLQYRKKAEGAADHHRSYYCGNGNISSVTASLVNNNELAVSNVVGSNIFNLMVVVGVCSILTPILVQKETIRRDIPFSMICALLLLGLGILAAGDTIGMRLGHLDGMILLGFFAGYIVVMIQSAMKARAAGKNVDMEGMEELEEEIGILSWPKSILFIVGGALAIAFGGDLTVDAASRIAIDLGMSQTLVGLTIVSIGTSLPELVTSVVAARKNEVDMAVGNAVGSNIFNILMVLGVASAINPVALIRENIIDIVILIVFSLIVWIYAATKQRISRKEGISMVCMYLIYAGYIIWR